MGQDSMPHLSVNFAISADGKITSADRRPSGWTSRADFNRMIELRRPADALLVGRGTLDVDRMTMTVPDAPVQPLRCVVSRLGRLDPEHPIFKRDGGAIHLLVAEDAEPDVPPGVTLHRGGLVRFLETLAIEHGVRHIHCEGGGELVRALAVEDMIDEIHITWAGRTLFGGRDAPTVTGVPGDFLPATRHFELAYFEPNPDAGECYLSWRRVR